MLRAKLRPGFRATLLSTTCSLAVAQIVFSLIIWGYGEAPRDVLALLFEGTWGTAYGAGQVLFKATPLLFCGIAVDIALRGGLFNIGAEGQLAVASLAVAIAGMLVPQGLPMPLGVLFIAGAAMCAGAAWALIPALLRARFGAHEVISTIMMNRIADAFVGLVFGYGIAIAGTARTQDLPLSVRIPKLEVAALAFRGSAASFAIFMALFASLLVWLWFRHARHGREISLVGMNPIACRAEGISVRHRLLQAMLLSGAVAGLASLATVSAYKGYYELGLGAGTGFGGIAVALLGRGHPLGLLFASLLLGTLQQGGLAINALVPMEIVDVLNAVIIAALALTDARSRSFVSAGIARVVGAR